MSKFFCEYDRNRWVVYLNDAGDAKYLCETNTEGKANEVVTAMNEYMAVFERNFAGIKAVDAGDSVASLTTRLAALTADRDALAALLKEAVSLLSIGIGIAESYSDDDQVGCLCIGDCYCRSGRLEELKQARKSLAARIDAASGGKA